VKRVVWSNIAYSGFLLSGIAGLTISVISYLPLDNGQAGALGFLILIPLSIVGLIGMLASIVCTIIYRQDSQLIILAVFSVIFLVEMAGEFGSSWFHNAIGITYGLAATYFPIRWFYKKSRSTKTNA